MSKTTIINARLIDPETGRDEIGALQVQDGIITDLGKKVKSAGEVIDANGLILAPGLIDMRVTTGEPGREGIETLKSAGQAAASGGVTSMVVMPHTKPVIDDTALLDYVTRRSEQNADVNVYIAGALTQNLGGENMTEIGLMAQAGAVMFSNGNVPIAHTQLMRRLLSYGSNFGVLISNRAMDASLAENTCAHESALSTRLGLVGSPSAAERIMVERDVALAELTGGRLFIDMISSRDAVEVVRRAKKKSTDIYCSVSINHLCLNEIDIGDYRTFAKLDPPLREEDDRQALLEAIGTGDIDVIVSDHYPRPAGQKRLPYSEAYPGAVGLELLLAAGLSQVNDGALELTAFLKAVTINPAKILGLPSGRLAKNAPADLTLIDPDLPWVCQSDGLLSKSKNTPFDGRRLTGRSVKTWVGGKLVFSRD